MLGGIGAGEEGDDRGWDGWMASLTWCTWVWVNSGSWWWTGRPGVLWFMGSQRVRHDWATEMNWTELKGMKSFPGGSVDKNMPANAGDTDFIPGSGRSPEERNGNPLQLFLPGKSHGQKSLAGNSPWGCKRVRHDLVTRRQVDKSRIKVLQWRRGLINLSKTQVLKSIP